MTQLTQIEVELPQAGKVLVEYKRLKTVIVASAGDLHFEGDLSFSGGDSAEARLEKAIQHALSTDLPVLVTYGALSCSGSMSFSDISA